MGPTISFPPGAGPKVPLLAPDRAPVAGRRVLLLATCLCDAFFDDVAVAAVEVLEAAGCAVEFREDQTCCGQPAFNAGDWAASRRVVRHLLRVLEGDAPVVVPSASCAAMILHGARLEFEGEPDAAEVAALARRTWELADFLVFGLGVASWGGRYERRAAFHRSCHSRGTGSGEAARRLLGSVAGLELRPFGEEEQCCGFGGTFAVAFPEVSAGMGRLKVEHLRESGAEEIISGDMSCLMHLAGLAGRAGSPLPVRHVAQVLRDARGGRGGA